MTSNDIADIVEATFLIFLASVSVSNLFHVIIWLDDYVNKFDGQSIQTYERLTTMILSRLII